MKHRPQVQLRFRDEEQYFATKAKAANSGLSLNEFLVRLLEQGGGTADAVDLNVTAPRGTARTPRQIAGSTPAPAIKTKKLSDADFQALSNSDRLRAQREGKY